MNSRAKGKRSELKTQKFLEKKGYQVYTAPVMQFRKNNDIFNLFDHVATNGDRLIFIQTKSNYCPKPVREAIKSFKLKAEKEIWVWKDYARKPIILEMN